MRIKAFDLGTNLGVAAATDDGGTLRPVFFGLLLPWGKGTRLVKGWNRWPLVRRCFLAEVSGCDRVFYEAPMGVKKNRDAERVLTGMELALEEACGTFGVPCVGVPQPTLKKWATGSGNAKKPEMLAAVPKFWGVPATDDNVADALCLLALAAATLGLSVPGGKFLPPEPPKPRARRKR